MEATREPYIDDFDGVAEAPSAPHGFHHASHRIAYSAIRDQNSCSWWKSNESNLVILCVDYRHVSGNAFGMSIDDIDFWKYRHTAISHQKHVSYFLSMSYGLLRALFPDRISSCFRKNISIISRISCFMDSRSMFWWKREGCDYDGNKWP